MRRRPECSRSRARRRGTSSEVMVVLLKTGEGDLGLVVVVVLLRLLLLDFLLFFFFLEGPLPNLDRSLNKPP